VADELEKVEKALRDLSKSLKGLSRKPRPEQVHKLRTSARRVQAIAAALPRILPKTSRRLVGSIEPLRKTAGRVRDMDVLAANLRKLAQDSSGGSLAPLAPLIDRLQSARAGGAEKLRRQLERSGKKARHTLKVFAHQAELSWPANGSGAHANGHAAHAGNGSRRNGLNPQAKRLAHRLAEWPPLDEENLHRFRVKLKELRYTLQLDAHADPGFVAALGSAQRSIGDWHDWRQLSTMVQEFIEPHRLPPDQHHSLMARIDEILSKKLARSLAATKALRREYLRSALPHVPGC